jgi:polyphosphate glucokinase
VTLTLSIDCGGGGIKAAVLDASNTPLTPPLRVPTPYPLPTQRFRDVLLQIVDQLPSADRVTVGLPGMVRHGVVITTPHYVTTAGPSTEVADHLVEQWWGFDAGVTIREWLHLPTLVLNDAELHAAGAVTGEGVEMVLTLGTGLGCAWTDRGQLAPHVELSQAQVPAGMTADDFIGERARQALGDAAWCIRVGELIAWLAPVFAWDHLHLGGGNARRISPDEVHRWPGAAGARVSLIANEVALVGGARAWDLGFGRPQPPLGPPSRHAV